MTLIGATLNRLIEERAYMHACAVDGAERLAADLFDPGWTEADIGPDDAPSTRITRNEYLMIQEMKTGNSPMFQARVQIAFERNMANRDDLNRSRTKELREDDRLQGPQL